MYNSMKYENIFKLKVKILSISSAESDSFLLLFFYCKLKEHFRGCIQSYQEKLLLWKQHIWGKVKSHIGR